MRGPQRASIAGAGSGTSLVGLAQFIDPIQHAFWHSAIVYAAPTVSVGVSAVWPFIARFVIGRIRIWQIDQALIRAKRLNASVQADSGASENHKKRARERVEKLEALLFEINQSGAEDP